MSNSNADNAKPAPVAGGSAVQAKSRARGERRGSGTAPARMNGITITRWSLGVCLSLALTVLTGAFTFQSGRISGVEDEVRGLRTALHTEINGLRQEMHAGINGLRQEMHAGINGLRQELRADMRGEIAVLREEVRADIGDLREEVRELAALIRARDAASQ